MSDSTVRGHALGQRPGWADEMAAMLDAYRQAGGDPDALQLPEAATLVISANEVLAAHDIPGVRFEAKPLSQGVRAVITVRRGARVERPVHLCFGVVPAEGRQYILAYYDIGAGAQVEFLAHCSFPNAVKVQHIMQANVRVGAGASMTYTEAHYHGPAGGVEVRPRAEVNVSEGGRFVTTFNLTRGRAGLLDLDYQVDVSADGLAELTTKAYGAGDDKISVREVVRLNGARARGLTKTRIAARDKAISQVYTTTEGNAPGARGHMSCTEIVRGRAEAHNTPLVIVRDDQAQVTHEAAIGAVNRKELESLLARGLGEDEAVDLIIRGMLQ